MALKYSKALFIFRRDLRLEDNTGLIFALTHAKTVIPSFIFTPEQLEHNTYRSDRALQFMLESLEDLEHSLQERQGRLYLFYGTPEKILERLIQQSGIDAVIVNRDYTPYSIKRDLTLASVCKKHDLPFLSFDDALLHPPEDTMKANNTPYTIFTPFYRFASSLDVLKPSKNSYTNYHQASIPGTEPHNLFKTLLPKRVRQAPGGRTQALILLKHLSRFSEYSKLRDIPAQDGTTHLSAHLKFTTCSPREVYHAISKQLGEDSDLIRSLYWRDFFSSIAFHFPYVFKGAFHQKFNNIHWNNNKKAFERWCTGTTGFPIVDAGMRELNTTGYMHNRVRMIVGSFLVKDLHINWQWGERYFATTLIDYDPAINNGNWQWVASTGCDAQPYFRIFNPWNQQVKFDPDCLYIKKWIPEVASLPNRVLHEWYMDQHHASCPTYPTPIVDHAKESKIALAAYKTLKHS